jgi:flagellar hook-associated protein 2
MGTLSSGVGLVSGLDIAALVDRLISLEARPRDLLKNRIGTIDAQKTALADVSARISALLSRIASLGRPTSFSSTSASSSLPTVLAASARENAVPGNYSFLVKALASTQQSVSRGFSAADTPVGTGTLSIESARARVTSSTRLDQLNGLSGVQRGSIRTVDATGNEKTVSLADVVTVGEAVERINSAGNNVRAALDGDRLVLTDTTGGRVEVREVSGGRTAADLGFGLGRTVGAGGRIEGSNVIFINAHTPLSGLNDGNGVDTSRVGGDFSINGKAIDLSRLVKPETRLERLNHGNGVALGTVRLTMLDKDNNQEIREVDLSGARTIDEVKDRIEDVAPDVTVTLTGSRLIVGYSDNAAKRITIDDVTGTAARDLGIAGDSTSGRITGRDILFNDTIGDVVNAINYADENDGTFTARIDGTRLVLQSTTGALTIAAPEGSSIISDLGLTKGTHGGSLAGRRLIAGLDTTLLSTLNGGRGLTAGLVRVQVGAAETMVDLSGAETLSEALKRLNDGAAAAGLAVDFGVDSNGMRVTAVSRDGSTTVSLSDRSGDFVQTLALGRSGASVRSGDLEHQYVSNATRLSELNGGRGVPAGRIKITDSSGQFANVDLSGPNIKNVRDVIEAINAAGIGVRARINDTGDGLLLEDTADGTLSLKVEDQGGTTARDLKLAGEFATGVVDGSYEQKIDLSAGSTLQEVVSRLNSVNGGLATAAILNDGTGTSPYRLQLSSRSSGTAGAFVIDSDVSGLDFSTLARPQDARVLVGASGDGGVLVTSSSNNFDNVVPGLNLTLLSASDTPVTVAVNRDNAGVKEALRGFVEGFNSAVDRIRELSKYDSEAQKGGILLGDAATQNAETRLFRAVTTSLGNAAGGMRRLAEIGIRLQGGKIAFDEAKFDAVLAARPQDVAEFFTRTETGMGAALKKNLEQIVGDNGIFERRNGTLDNQKQDINDRIDRLNALLDRRRERLTRQFQAMETSLSRLQGQQSALGQLGSLAASSSQSGPR